MGLFDKKDEETTETQKVQEVQEEPKKKTRKRKTKKENIEQESPSENQGVTKSQQKGPTAMATPKEYLRNFMIYRIHTTNVDTHDVAYDIVGATYPFERYNPQEVKALEKWIYKNGTRIGVDLGDLDATTTDNGSITQIGGVPGDYTYEIVIGDTGYTNVFSPDANPLLTAPDTEGFFMIEFYLFNNPGATVQNFSGCDNTTSFYNGDGGSIGKIAFQYIQGACGADEKNKYFMQFKGEPGSSVNLSNLKVYKVIPN